MQSWQNKFAQINLQEFRQVKFLWIRVRKSCLGGNYTVLNYVHERYIWTAYSMCITFELESSVLPDVTEI